jgi:hypothetical protein
MLIEVKVTLWLGDTLDHLIFMFDRTHLSNSAGDKTEWPEHMKIGNLSSKIRQMPSAHSVIIVALLPILIKNCTMPQKGLDEQRLTNQEVLNEVLWRVLQSPIFTHNPSVETGSYNVLCADCNFRRCTPGLAVKLPEFGEDSDLHHPEQHVSFLSEYPKNVLRDCVPCDKQHPRRDHNLYITRSNTNTQVADAKLSSCLVHQGFNVFRHIPCMRSDLPKADLAHTMLIGMLHPLPKWIIHFIKTHERLDNHNAIWLSVPAYHDFTPKHKLFEDVPQWNGQEMKEMSRYLLRVVTQSLPGGRPA